MWKSSVRSIERLTQVVITYPENFEESSLPPSVSCLWPPHHPEAAAHRCVDGSCAQISDSLCSGAAYRFLFHSCSFEFPEVEEINRTIHP